LFQRPKKSNFAKLVDEGGKQVGEGFSTKKEWIDTKKQENKQKKD
jgi:hypothetical protein